MAGLDKSMFYIIEKGWNYCGKGDKTLILQ